MRWNAACRRGSGAAAASVAFRRPSTKSQWRSVPGPPKHLRTLALGDPSAQTATTELTSTTMPRLWSMVHWRRLRKLREPSADTCSGPEFKSDGRRRGPSQPSHSLRCTESRAPRGAPARRPIVVSSCTRAIRALDCRPIAHGSWRAWPSVLPDRGSRGLGSRWLPLALGLGGR